MLKLPSPLRELSESDPPTELTGSYPLTPPIVLSAEPSIEVARSWFENLIARVGSALGLDRAIVFTILARGWSSTAGIATLVLLTRFLTPVEQGYYYTFYSLVALQIIFELGFSTVILQTASHEIAHLRIGPDDRITGPTSSHARLASILQKSVRWYGIATVLMAMIVLPLGMRFFRAQDHAASSHATVAWLYPWILVVLATSCTFQIDPIFSFMEGCGFVAQVARVRLAQAVVGTVMGWIALLLHHGLLAPGCMIVGQAFAGSWFVVGKRRLLLPLLRTDSREHRIHWGSEVWPFQWRIAVSWLCGYLIFQLFNPILFHYRGPAAAGQMGMSVNICGTLTMMAIAWINTKASPFGQMIARRQFAQLDKAFFGALRHSIWVAGVACSLVLTTVVVLHAHHVAFAARLLPPLPFAMLLVTTILNIVVAAEALYLRCHKEEKFMRISIASALWTAPAALYFGQRYGSYGITSIYLLGTLVIGLGYGTFVFSKWRRIWHQA